MQKFVKFFDTTLRDGEQTPKVNFSLREKLEITKRLAALRVDVIEAGFAAASEGDFKAVAAIARQTRGCIIASLARALLSDVERAWEALREAEAPRIHIVIATSELHMEHKLQMAPEEVLERAVASVRLAKSLCPDVQFSPEDASRSDRRFLCRVLEAVIAAGATVVNIADTVGYAVPAEFAELIRHVRENVPNIGRAEISVHCHNDLGLAVANTLAAVGAGATQVECTVNGLGERAGNAALEELVMGLNTRSAYYQARHNIDSTKLF
ncbi:MAG: 2-isopropylmalate synthase, partial [Clostridiales bacterium]|nr:2-isopropylmalate synthase [Clostridiales bacterium]